MMSVCLFWVKLFESFSKNKGEVQLFEEFEDLLSFDLNLKAKVRMDEVSLSANYDYDREVLD